MEVFERIKELRKEHLSLSQTAFGERLGVNRDTINNIELNRLAKPEQKLSLYKLICKEFNVNEEWLLYGTGSIFVESDTFSLDAFCEQRKATDLEKEIIKAYLDLDPDIRKKVLDHFKSRLCRFAEDAPSNVTIFRAARSDNDTPPGEVEMSASDLKKLKTATPITSDDDI